MASRIVRFLTGEPNWADYLFRAPPRQPDARMVYIGGCGIITMIRGLFYIFGDPPTAALFENLGRGFVLFWSIMWVATGVAVIVVAGTGHRWPHADRFAAFIMLMLWWVWGALFLLSGLLFAGEGRAARDIYSGLGLLVTGVVIAAGVIQGLRKTQEIQLREIAVRRIRELEEALVKIAAENEALRKEGGGGGGSE